MLLKLSRSMNSSANCCDSRCACASAARELVLEIEAVRQRSQRIVVGLVVELLVLRCRGEGDTDAVAEIPRAPAFLVGKDPGTDETPIRPCRRWLHAI